LEEVLKAVKSADVEKILKAGEKLASWLEKSYFLEPNDDTFIFRLKCEHCDSVNLTQDSDTLDTWFSSGLRPFTVL
jgi:valyl-tRNA synthetase